MADYIDILNPFSEIARHAERLVLRKGKESLARAGKAALQKATQPVLDTAGFVKRSATTVDKSVGFATTVFCAAPALWISESDWAGQAILARYLSGRGDWSISDDPKWTAYMQASSLLRRQVNDKLGEIVKSSAATRKPGLNEVINAVFHAEVENGEGIVGYQYLHGTNKSTGDFKVQGALHTVHISTAGNVEFSATLRLTWNDMIDPNPTYKSDTMKSRYAEACTLGRAAAYRISISWKETRKVLWNASASYLRDK